MIFFSGLFATSAVEVRGNELADGEGIMKTAKEAAIRGKWFYELTGSNNILFWREAEMVDLPAGLLQVASIKVSKDLKERKIIIEAIERNKFVVWCEGDCFWMDEAGVLFSEAPEAEGMLIKIIRVNSDRKLALGERPLPEKETKNFVEIISFLDNLGLTATDMEIGDLRFKEINARIFGGPKVLFSLIIDPTFGKPAIESLRKSGLWEKIEYLDLRVDGRAYYKLK